MTNKRRLIHHLILIHPIHEEVDEEMTNKRKNSICRLLHCSSVKECDGTCETYCEVADYIETWRFDREEMKK